MAGNIIELHTEVPAELEANVFGQFDEHLKLIERTLNVTVISRDGILKILGNEQNAASAKKLIEELTVLAKRGNTITKQNVNYALSLAMEQRNEVLTEIDKDFICFFFLVCFFLFFCWLNYQGYRLNNNYDIGFD